MRTSRISYGFCIAFVVGIFALQWWQVPTYPWWIWTEIAACAVIGMVTLLKVSLRETGAIYLAILCGLSLALWRVGATTHITTRESIEHFAHGTTVTIHGTIIREPDRRPMETKLTIATDTLTFSGSSIPVTGRVLATDYDGWPEHNYGDEVTATGRLTRPGIIDTFSYDNYLSLDDIYAVISRAHVVSLHGLNDQYLGSIDHALDVMHAALYNLKRQFEDRINRLQPEPHASFLAGLLTGSRKGIPAHTMNNFQITGLTHIIAISGSNITIIIVALTGLLFWLPLKWRFAPLVIGIAIFTIMVGASASVVRAAVMGILGLIALQNGRRSTSGLLILWTAVFMLTWNPKQLWYDAGFQLSFAAIIGLAVFSEPLTRILKRVPETLGLRESLVATLSAQIATLPIIVYTFGRLSLIAPVTNLLAAPLIPIAMLLGFVSVIVSYISFPLGQLIGYLGWGCLELILLIAKVFAEIPFASITI